MKHKYVTENNTVFYIENTTQQLFNADNKPFFGNELPSGFVQRTISKTKSPNEIKIILGQGCNFNCGYCSQKDIGDHSNKYKKFDVQNLIKTMEKNLDLSSLEQIELWGGETLLWWNEIKELMLWKDKEDFDWVIPTNGSLLNNDKLNFLLSLKGRTTIELSHDGPYHKENRGIEFLHKIKEIFKIVEQNNEKIRIVISATITKNGFDLMEINNWWYNWFKENEINPVPLMIRPVWSYDLISSEFSLNDVLQQYKEKLEEYLNEQLKQFKKHKKVVNDKMIISQLFHIPEDTDENAGILQMAANFKMPKSVGYGTICGIDNEQKITIDWMGNLRACQNTGQDYFSGNIQDDKNSFLINGINYETKDKCKICPVWSWCRGGCPLDINETMFEENCKTNFLHYETMLIKSLEFIFNQKIKRKS